jgi:hypothetical protein
MTEIWTRAIPIRTNEPVLLEFDYIPTLLEFELHGVVVDRFFGDDNVRDEIADSCRIAFRPRGIVLDVANDEQQSLTDTEALGQLFATLQFRLDPLAGELDLTFQISHLGVSASWSCCSALPSGSLG